MKTEVAIFTLLLHLVVPPIVKMEICNCPYHDDFYDLDVVSCLTEALQTQLTSTSTNIRQLQEMFYFSNNVQSFAIFTNMTVSGYSSLSSEFMLVKSYQWYHLWYEDNFLRVIRELLTDADFSPFQLQWVDPLTFLLLISTQFDFQVQARDPLMDSISAQVNIHLNCTSRGEPVQIDEEELRGIWEEILQWSKAYARTGGPLPAPSDSDKGQISAFCIDRYCSMPSDVIFRFCLAFHIILNLVVGIIIVVCMPSQMNKRNVSSATSSLCWSSAIIGAPFALIFIGAKLILTILVWLAYDEKSILFSKEYVCYSSITCLLLLFLLTVELIVAILRSKHSGLAVPRCMGFCCSFFCFCRFCCCCRPGGQSHSHVARALALWFVMAWFQSIATSVVPVIIDVLVLVNPLPMLAFLAMFVSTFFGMVVFLAVLVHLCHQHDRSKRCILFTYSVILVGVLAMVCLAIFFLLVINKSGGQVNSVRGFIGTLVPSAILSIITLIVKKKVFGKKPTEDQSSEQPQEVQDEETQDENISQPLLEDV